MQHITIYDYLLLPLYLYLFYIIVKRRSVKYTDPVVRKHFFNSFYLRMFGSVAYSLLVQYYYGYGDSFTYYVGSNFLTDQVSSNLGNVSYFFASPQEVYNAYTTQVGDYNYAGYFAIGSALFIMKISAALSYLSFNKFLIISLFFGFFSFIGQWRLFKVFNHINKYKHQNLLAWAVLYSPSIWFWGSGLMKDSVCIGAVGIILHILYFSFVNRRFSLKELALLVFLVFIVWNIKSYIISILAVGLVSTLLLKSLTSIKNILIKSFIITVFFIAMVAVAFLANFSEQLKTLAEESQQQVLSFQQSYQAIQQEDETSRATIEMKAIDPSISGILTYSPIAVFNCLFRPFLWESRKVIILFTSLESTLLLLSTLYLLGITRFFGFFKSIFNNEYLFFCFSVSILFALIIGFTTYNFGTMVRYKIILLPFYYFLLVSIFTKFTQQRATPG